jgi:antitoxin HicB
MAGGYPISLTWSKEDNTYHARCRDLPEVLTSGRTRTKALEMAADALEVAIAGRIKDEADVSLPSKARKREHLVPLSARLWARPLFVERGTPFSPGKAGGQPGIGVP